ncbi:hypothetical protein AVEN_261978-1 [Araneus ventricosus]|uniref:Uncharacterized protein n=1 Tax=Araneus ventricosus TaxID=182803 RepID=A0A4Y2VAW1_ARAVE|nr:hypothetical protein AVEN_261978-1 [Araneus ventricosus]
MRSYHQVQTWLGNEKDPLKWGWMHTPSGLFPKKSEKDPASDVKYPVILDKESEEGDAPALIDMVDEQLECEDIEL